MYVHFLSFHHFQFLLCQVNSCVRSDKEKEKIIQQKYPSMSTLVCTYVLYVKYNFLNSSWVLKTRAGYRLKFNNSVDTISEFLHLSIGVIMTLFQKLTLKNKYMFLYKILFYLTKGNPLSQRLNLCLMIKIKNYLVKKI